MKVFLIAFFSLFIQNSYAQIQGVVFNDVNENGKIDEGEKGLSNIAVSNGLHVVLTDEQGRYHLNEWEKAKFVTVYPSGGIQPKNRFYNINSESKSYDFPVTLIENKSEVTFVQISDTETYEHKDWLNNLKSYIKNESPDFVVHTGDICYESGMKWHADQVNEEELGVPIYYCLGNHDLVKGAYGEAFFEDKFGPAWYAFQKGNSLYVITPMMHGDYKPGFNRKEIGEWLSNLLKVYPASMPKYFFNHDLLSNTEQFTFKIDEKKSIDLNDFNLKAWIFGHFHINMTKTHKGGAVKSYSTTTTSQGGIDSSPSSFRVIHVDKLGESKSELRWTFVKDDLKILNPSDGRVLLNKNKKIPVSVNTYSSNAKIDSVKYIVYDADKRHWNTAIQEKDMIHLKRNSDWNWGAEVSPLDSVKNYRMVVNAYLKNGTVLFQQAMFELQNDLLIQPDLKSIWNHLGSNPEHDAQINLNHSSEYQLNWVTNIGSNIYMSSPIIYKDKVLTSSFDDGNAKNNAIVCLDTASGDINWSFPTSNGIKNQMILDGQNIIGIDLQGILYCVSIQTGQLVWKKDLGHDRLPAIVTGIVGSKGVVYAGFGSSLQAIDSRNGETIWKNKDWNGGEGATTTMTIANDLLIASSNWRGLYAHDLKTGELRWKRTDQGLRYRNGNALYKDGFLWIAENDKSKGMLHILDVKTGSTVKKIETSMQNKATTTPIVTKRQLFIAGSHPGIASFDRSSGKKLWKYDVSPAILYSPQYYSDQQQSIQSTPILIGDSLVFGAMDGWVYVIDATSGKERWKSYVGAPILTSAAVTKSGFYIGDFAGNVYYFSIKK